MSNSFTFPVVLGKAAALKLKVDCHLPAPIIDSESDDDALVGPNNSFETFVEVIAAIVTD